MKIFKRPESSSARADLVLVFRSYCAEDADSVYELLVSHNVRARRVTEAQPQTNYSWPLAPSFGRKPHRVLVGNDQMLNASTVLDEHFSELGIGSNVFDFFLPTIFLIGSVTSIAILCILPTEFRFYGLFSILVVGWLIYAYRLLATRPVDRDR